MYTSQKKLIYTNKYYYKRYKNKLNNIKTNINKNTLLLTKLNSNSSTNNINLTPNDLKVLNLYQTKYSKIYNLIYTKKNLYGYKHFKKALRANNQIMKNSILYKNTHHNYSVLAHTKNNNKNKKTKITYLKIYKHTNDFTKYYQYFLKHEKNKNILKVYINTTLNNIFVTYIFDNKIHSKSIASLGFRGKRTLTTYALKIFSEQIFKDIQELISSYKQISNKQILIDIYFKSLNYKFKTFYNSFKHKKLNINKIYIVYNPVFNGCRKRKIVIRKKKKSIIKSLNYIN